MIRATAADQPEIEGFLRAHVETSMFALSNLSTHGMSGGHPRALRVWLSDRPITGLLAVTQEGMVMPRWPDSDFSGAADELADQPIIGILGEPDQVRAVRSALGLTNAPAHMDKDEPLFSLSLSDLRMPTQGPTDSLIPLGDAPQDVVLAWRTAYHIETLGTPPAKAGDSAERDLEAYRKANSHRVLMRDGAPVAMTGFNARLPDIVQLGGVWTAPPLRGQGLARLAVALHLAEVRDQGVTRAILFSASDMAARAYRAIGFTQIGWFNLTLFDGPQEVRHG